MQNKMSIKQKLIGVLLAIVALLGGTATLGSVTGGTPATVATSTFQAVVAATPELLFATSTSCSSRIITTQTNPVRLTFSDFTGQRPTSAGGVFQAGSTTIAYEAETYGCNAVYVYPYGTDTLTVIETR